MRIKFCTTIVPSKPKIYILYGKLVRCRIYGNMMPTKDPFCVSEHGTPK